jgi:hypothetical protein
MMITPYLIEKYQRTSYPFATYVFTLIGVSIASRKVRGGTGLHLALGVFSEPVLHLRHEVDHRSCIQCWSRTRACGLAAQCPVRDRWCTPLSAGTEIRVPRTTPETISSVNKSRSRTAERISLHTCSPIAYCSTCCPFR